MLYPDLAAYVEARLQEFDEIPEQRKQDLSEVADFVRERPDPDLTFICTHNSRRSHLSQVWAEAAAAHFGTKDITAYSGGTEATAFHPHAVAAMVRAGFRIERTTEARNPIYHVRFGDTRQPVTCFSKVYNSAPNPTDGFCAVMTCTSADEACPVVLGAAKRVSIPYEDPKNFDGTEKEQAAYDDRCRQIGREILYLFSRV